MKRNVTKGKSKVRINNSTYRHVVKLRILAILGFVVYFFVAIFTAVFVYTNVYNTIGFVDLAALATIDTGAEVIDFEALEQVNSAWDQKLNASTTIFSRNPFTSVVLDATLQTSTNSVPQAPVSNAVIETSL